MQNRELPDVTHLCNDEHVKRLDRLIRRVHAMGDAVYRMGPTTADSATPREIVADVLDELVRQKRAYEAVPGIFDEPANTQPAGAPETQVEVQAETVDNILSTKPKPNHKRKP